MLASKPFNEVLAAHRAARAAASHAGARVTTTHGGRPAARGAARGAAPISSGLMQS